MTRRNHLFVLANPSIESARIAVKLARDANLRVPGQYGEHAIEIVASAAEADRLFACGLFAMKTAGAIAREHLEDLEGKALDYLQQWNRRFAPAYRRAKKDKSRIGRSLVAKGFATPGPYARFEPADIIPRWREIARREKLKEPSKTRLTQYGVQAKNVRGKHYRNAREYFRKHVEDPVLAVDIGDLYVRSPREARYLFFDAKWLEVLLELLHEILIHGDVGDEPACRKMHGRNSVGIVFVNSSRSGGPRFNSNARNDITNEIKSGLAWLVSEHPAGDLTWVYDEQVVAIDVADQADQDDSSSTFDEYWRFPAMERIEFHGHTYAGSNAGTDDYRRDMRAHHGTDHAIVIFVTRFGTSWHAYSSGRRFILLSEHGDDWGHWGQNDLNFIAAHEMCHQFGARDEYSGSGTPCDSCNDLAGCDAIPNGNCEGCARPPQQCVMRVHEPSLCAYTRGQIGWADIFVELFTDDEWLSGTDDHVELDIGDRTFTLDTPNHDDRENNNREGYAIWAGGDLARDDIKRILIRKSPDGWFGGWKLRRVRVFHDGEEICDESPAQWLEDRRCWFLACSFDDDLVNRIRLRVRTADVMWAGTDDNVTLKLAGRSWDIDSDANDFERGSTRWYELDPRTGIRIADLSTITVEKSPDGFFGGWKLGGLRLQINGSTIYDNNSINQWLEDDDRVFADGI